MKIKPETVVVALIALVVLIKASIWVIANILPIIAGLIIVAGMVAGIFLWNNQQRRLPRLIIVAMYTVLLVRGIIWVVANGRYALDLFLYLVIAAILALAAFVGIMYWKQYERNPNTVESALLAVVGIFIVLMFYGGRSASFHHQRRGLEKRFVAVAGSGSYSINYATHTRDYYGSLDEIVAARNKLCRDYGYKSYGTWWVDDSGIHTDMSFTFPAWLG
jgi:hypothetical protein